MPWYRLRAEALENSESDMRAQFDGLTKAKEALSEQVPQPLYLPLSISLSVSVSMSDFVPVSVACHI
jgi:hypothetical protein